MDTSTTSSPVPIVTTSAADRRLCAGCREVWVRSGRDRCWYCRTGSRYPRCGGDVAVDWIGDQLDHWRDVRDSSVSGEGERFVAYTYIDVLLAVQKRLGGS